MGDADALMKQGIGNYKGLMICTRPNDKIQQLFNRPFVSRVEAKEQIGLNPAPKVQMHKPIKRIHHVLAKHKLWLEGYKQDVREKMYSKNQEIVDKISRSNQLRAQSINHINRRREQHLNENQGSQYLQSQDNYMSDDNQNNQVYQQRHQNQQPQQQNENSIDINPDQLERILNEPAQPQNGQELKQSQVSNARPQASVQKQKNKKEKPQWAKTEKQLQEEEFQECDDLLNFASTLDYDKYINDMEVQSMVKAIKERVSELKSNPSIYDSQVLPEKEQAQPKRRENIDELRSNQGENHNQEGRSNASAKSKLTMQSIKEQVDKVKTDNKEEWDKSTTCGEQKYKSNIEEKLVRHLADDILKNNKYLRGIHSTNSIKQILVGEAKKHFEDTGAKYAQNL